MSDIATIHRRIDKLHNMAVKLNAKLKTEKFTVSEFSRLRWQLKDEIASINTDLIAIIVGTIEKG